MTTPSTFDADTMNSAQPVPSAQPDQQAPQPAQQSAVPTKFDAATMQTAQSLPAAPAKFDAATMQGAQPIQQFAPKQSTQAATGTPNAADDAMADVKDAAGVVSNPSSMTSKIKGWAWSGLLKAETLKKYLEVAEDYYGEKGNILWDPIPEHLRKTDPLVNLPENKTLAKVPVAGHIFEGGQFGVQDYTNRVASQFTSQQTSLANMALFGAGPLARVVGTTGEMITGTRVLQTAITDMEGAEAIRKAVTSDVEAALTQTKNAEQVVKSAEQALTEGKTTEAAVNQAKTAWSEEAANLQKAQQAAKEATEAHNTAASSVEKAIDNVHRISTTARGAAGRAVGTAGQTIQAAQQVGGKTLIVSQIPDIIEGRREGETPMDALERLASAM